MRSILIVGLLKSIAAALVLSAQAFALEPGIAGEARQVALSQVPGSHKQILEFPEQVRFEDSEILVGADGRFAIAVERGNVLDFFAPFGNSALLVEAQTDFRTLGIVELYAVDSVRVFGVETVIVFAAKDIHGTGIFMAYYDTSALEGEDRISVVSILRYPEPIEDISLLSLATGSWSDFFVTIRVDGRFEVIHVEYPSLENPSVVFSTAEDVVFSAIASKDMSSGLFVVEESGDGSLRALFFHVANSGIERFDTNLPVTGAVVASMGHGYGRASLVVGQDLVDLGFDEAARSLNVAVQIHGVSGILGFDRFSGTMFVEDSASAEVIAYRDGLAVGTFDLADDDRGLFFSTQGYILYDDGTLFSSPGGRLKSGGAIIAVVSDTSSYASFGKVVVYRHGGLGLVLVDSYGNAVDSVVSHTDIVDEPMLRIFFDRYGMADGGTVVFDGQNFIRLLK